MTFTVTGDDGIAYSSKKGYFRELPYRPDLNKPGQRVRYELEDDAEGGGTGGGKVPVNLSYD